MRLRLSTDSGSGSCHSAYPDCAKFDQSAYSCRFTWQRWSNAAKEGKLGSLRPLFGTAVKENLLLLRSQVYLLRAQLRTQSSRLHSTLPLFFFLLPLPLKSTFSPATSTSRNHAIFRFSQSCHNPRRRCTWYVTSSTSFSSPVLTPSSHSQLILAFMILLPHLSNSLVGPFMSVQRRSVLLKHRV